MAKWLQWTNGNKCHSKLYQVNAIRNMCEWVLMPDQIISELYNEWQVWVLLAKWLHWTNEYKCHSKLYQQMTTNGKYQANGKQMAITSANDKWVANIKQMANKWQL